MSQSLAGEAPMDDYKEKQKEISIIADAQRLLQDAKEREYEPDAIKAIQNAVKAIANCDAARYDGDKEYTDKEVDDMPADKYKQVLKKKGIVVEVEED